MLWKRMLSSLLSTCYSWLLILFFPLEYAYTKIKEHLITFFLSIVFNFTHKFVQIFQKCSEMFLQITFFFFLFFNVQVICPDNLLVLAVYPFFVCYSQGISFLSGYLHVRSCMLFCSIYNIRFQVVNFSDSTVSLQFKFHIFLYERWCYDWCQRCCRLVYF